MGACSSSMTGKGFENRNRRRKENGIKAIRSRDDVYKSKPAGDFEWFQRSSFSSDSNNGCFWRGHGRCRSTRPRSSARFWQDKIKGNTRRGRDDDECLFNLDDEQFNLVGG